MAVMTLALLNVVQLSLNGEYFEGGAPYDYLADPSVVSVHPTGGPLSGGTVLTVRGRGFRGRRQIHGAQQSRRSPKSR